MKGCVSFINLFDQQKFYKTSKDSLTPWELDFSLETKHREPHPFRKKSSWLPPQNNSTLEDYLKKTEQLFSPTPPIQTHHQNLTKEEKQALTQLKNNQDIIIKAADKGSGVVLENKSDYLKNGLEHLSDRKIYLPLPADPTANIANEINLSIKTLHEAGYLDFSLYQIKSAHITLKRFIKILLA